jgi:hypothetical protein
LSVEMSENRLSQVVHLTFELRSIALHEPVTLTEVMPPSHRPRPVEASRRWGTRSTMPCDVVYQARAPLTTIEQPKPGSPSPSLQFSPDIVTAVGVPVAGRRL